MRVSNDSVSNDCLESRHLFWEFYALNHLWFKLGDGMETQNYKIQDGIIIYENLRNKINFKFEYVVDKFFDKLQNALEISIRSEFKYPFGWVNRQPFLDVSIRGEKSFKDFFEYVKEENPLIDILESSDVVPISWGKVVFNWEGWSGEYCGVYWAEACGVWQESLNCKTIVQKIGWIDKVLDLQHNNGFLLDKTSFAALSADGKIKRKCIRYNKNPMEYARNDLDRRHEISNWFDAVRESEHYVQSFDIGNDEDEKIKIEIENVTVPVSGWTRRVILTQKEKIV